MSPTKPPAPRRCHRAIRGPHPAGGALGDLLEGARMLLSLALALGLGAVGSYLAVLCAALLAAAAHILLSRLLPALLLLAQLLLSALLLLCCLQWLGETLTRLLGLPNPA